MLNGILLSSPKLPPNLPRVDPKVASQICPNLHTGEPDWFLRAQSGANDIASIAGRDRGGCVAGPLGGEASAGRAGPCQEGRHVVPRVVLPKASG